jgi:hypothetical protein
MPGTSTDTSFAFNLLNLTSSDLAAYPIFSGLFGDFGSTTAVRWANL